MFSCSLWKTFAKSGSLPGDTSGASRMTPWATSHHNEIGTLKGYYVQVLTRISMFLFKAAREPTGLWSCRVEEYLENLEASKEGICLEFRGIPDDSVSDSEVQG